MSSVSTKSEKKDENKIEEEKKENKEFDHTKQDEKILRREFKQFGLLMNKDTLVIELDDLDQYLKEKENYENKDEDKIPFIVYLNNKFVKQVRRNRNYRRCRKMLKICGLVVVCLIIGIAIGKLINLAG